MAFNAGSITTITYNIPRYDVIGHLRASAAESVKSDNEFVKKLRDIGGNSGRAIQDALSLSDEALDLDTKSSNLLKDIEKGLGEIRDKEVEFSRLRLEQAREQLRFVGSIGTLSGPRGASIIFGHLEEIARNIQSISKSF